MKYKMIIGWSDSSDCYVSYIPMLPGCMSTGSTYGECAANGDDAARSWLETAKELGRELPKGPGGAVLD